MEPLCGDRSRNPVKISRRLRRHSRARSARCSSSCRPRSPRPARLAFAQQPGEAGMNNDRHRRARPALDRRVHLGLGLRDVHDVKAAAVGETRNPAPGFPGCGRDRASPSTRRRPRRSRRSRTRWTWTSGGTISRKRAQVSRLSSYEFLDQQRDDAAPHFSANPTSCETPALPGRRRSRA